MLTLGSDNGYRESDTRVAGYSTVHRSVGWRWGRNFATTGRAPREVPDSNLSKFYGALKLSCCF